MIVRARSAFAARGRASAKGKAGVKKRPASANAPPAKVAKLTLSTGEPIRPKAPNVKGAKQPLPVKWFGGTVYVSKSKSCFRVIRGEGHEFRVDTQVAWAKYESVDAAWGHALDIISHERSTEG